MIIEISSVGEARLLEGEDFRRFKLLLRGDFDTMTLAVDGVTFVDEHNALVDIEIVPWLLEVPESADWRKGYQEMIDTAKKHGWIDTERAAIRVHVER